jgi:hypothetical protein
MGELENKSESPPAPIPVIPIAQPIPQPPFWPAGILMVMRTDAKLPARCIKCNRDTKIYLRKKLFWMEARKASLAEKIPFAGWVFAFVRWVGELRTLKAPAVNLPICGFHRGLSRILTAIAILTFPASFLVLLTSWDDLYQILIPMAGFAISAIAWVLPRPVKPTHVGLGYVTMSGCGSEFLRSLREPMMEMPPIGRRKERKGIEATQPPRSSNPDRSGG